MSISAHGPCLGSSNDVSGLVLLVSPIRDSGTEYRISRSSLSRFVRFKDAANNVTDVSGKWRPVFLNENASPKNSFTGFLDQTISRFAGIGVIL